MRWLSYFIFAYVMLGLQVGVARAMQCSGAEPNFVLLAVVFIALNAPRDAALLACFILGALQDLTAGGTMGLFSLSYGLVAVLVVGIQRAVDRRHPVTHFTVTLIAGMLTAVVLTIHRWLHPPGPQILPLLYGAVYSAILAPIVLGGLQRIGRVFRFQTSRARI
jgi:rod shape-determining protein MreD